MDAKFDNFEAMLSDMEIIRTSMQKQKNESFTSSESNDGDRVTRITVNIKQHIVLSKIWNIASLAFL